MIARPLAHGDPRTSLQTGSLLFPAALIFILALLAYQCWTGFQAARREARITVSNLADVLTLNIKSSLDRARSDLGAFAAEVTTDDLGASLSEDRRVAIETQLNNHLRDFDAVLNYRVFNADGQTVFGAGRANPHANFNVADRAWFQHLRGGAGRPFTLSEVLVSRATGTQGIFLALPIHDRNGRFIGAVNAHINLDWFQASIDNLDIGHEGLVTLRNRESSRLILRRPKVEEQLNEANTGLFQLHVSDIAQAEGEFVSAIDHIRRVYAFRGIEGYPLSVVIAVSAADYLKSWYFQTAVTAVAALQLSALLFLLHRRLAKAYATSLAQAGALQEMNINLQRSNAELEEYAYVASHDLQSPLRNIASYSQLLQRRFSEKLGDEGEEFINFIVTNAFRMSGLIQDLLEYARVSRQSQPPRAVQSAELLAQAVADLAQPIEATGATVTASVLPAVLINKHHLSSLFRNLLDNAIKYRHPNRPPAIAVSAEATADGHWWRFSIADNGIGIEPDYQEKIFAIFQRLHPVDRYEGSGIGLALCRRIVHQCDGDIWVTSTPGEGTTFSFTLPAAEESPP